ncbi:hypothetical protein AVEN_207392-1 [Araneus ventricosus]|uniref:Transposable element Tc3 transposase n=1 Tax=Araneus ventricosus TaxID=182803 RepID=A0A4Y2LS80_ARAVE|nr:hypothetical protein AVEN_207392-1 [Araneus ventricosus]
MCYREWSRICNHMVRRSADLLTGEVPFASRLDVPNAQEYNQIFGLSTDVIVMKKKWNLGGPDGNIKYWHDLRKEPRSVFSRQSGDGSVMVWAAFSFNGQVGLAFLDGRQNSPKYIETLENHLMPFAEIIGGRNW